MVAVSGVTARAVGANASPRAASVPTASAAPVPVRLPFMESGSLPVVGTAMWGWTGGAFRRTAGFTGVVRDAAQAESDGPSESPVPLMRVGWGTASRNSGQVLPGVSACGHGAPHGAVDACHQHRSPRSAQVPDGGPVL